MLLDGPARPTRTTSANGETTMTDFNETAPPQPPPVPPSADGPGAEERQWAMFAHLSALVGGILTSGWAGSIGCFIGPLIIWLVKKDTLPFVDDQATEALNFNITVHSAVPAPLPLSVLTLGYLLSLTVPLCMLIELYCLVLII